MTAATRRKARHQAVPALPEIRHMAADNLEIRDSSTDSSGDTVVVEGMWCRYNVGYMVPDAFGEFEERMLPGVCGDLMNRADVRFLVDHNPSMLLARTQSGTLTLSDSADGAMMSATVDLRDSDARNLIVRLERGDVSQMSCGFMVARDQWNDAMDERDVILFRNLLDVSSVTYAASPTTQLDVARRMIEAGPVGSRARLRKLYIDVRAGKMLSAKNQDRITTAVTTLHELLDDAAIATTEVDGNVEVTPDDGSDGAALAPGGDGSDAAGARSDENEGEETRAVERRDSASYSDIEQQVCAALVDHLQDKGVANPDLCLEDCGDDWAIFTLWPACQTFKITYSLDENGACSFGEYDAVNRVTSWEPAAERSHLTTGDDASTVSETRSDLRLRISVGKRRG